MDKATEMNGHDGSTDRLFDGLHRGGRSGGNNGGVGGARNNTFNARELLDRMSKSGINDTKVFDDFIGHVFSNKPGREDLDMTEERGAVVTSIRAKVIKTIGEELFVHGPDKAGELILITALTAVVLDLTSAYPDLAAKLVPNMVMGDLLGLGQRG